MSSRLSDAQRDALLRLAQAWCRGRAEPWDDIRPQTREALRRAGLADRGILPGGLYALVVAGPVVGAWATQLQRAAEADTRRRAHLRAWWAEVPVARGPEGAMPIVIAADLRAAADALEPLEAARREAQAEADRLRDLARAEVRAVLRVEVEVPAGRNP